MLEHFAAGAVLIYAYGAVLAWMYRYLAGIAPDVSAPGFRRIMMRPVFDRRLGFVKASYRSAAGLVRSEWHCEGETVVWTFEIPAGAEARVRLPGATEEKTYGTGTHVVRTVDNHISADQK